MYEFEPACLLGVKLAGVHWWHKSRSHAAELTAGGTPPHSFASACNGCCQSRGAAWQVLLHGKHHEHLQDARGVCLLAVCFVCQR